MNAFAIGLAAQWLFDRIRHSLYRIMPMRPANVLGLFLAILFGFVITRDGVVQSSNAIQLMRDMGLDV